MRKNNLKSFFSGMLVMALLFSLSLTAFAAAQTISVNGGVKLKIDGQIFTPKDAKGNVVDVFEYNGTTYVPVRAVSQAFNKEVAWDQATRTVIIGANDSSGSYNRQNPAPVGKDQSITISDYSGNKYAITMSIMESVRGADAQKMLTEANPFNGTPQEGEEFIVAKVKATITSGPQDTPYVFNSMSLAPYSTDNVQYPTVIAVDPSPSFDGSVFDGGTLEGYITFMVKQSDQSPKAVFGQSYDGSGGIWFSLTK